MKEFLRNFYRKAIDPLIATALQQQEPDEVNRKAKEIAKTLTEKEIAYLLVESCKYIFSHNLEEFNGS